jgi:hypothetical protein
VNYVRLASDSGDYIGAGQTHEYNQTNAVITVTDTAGYFHIHVDGEQWWSGDFLEPSALTRLQVGNYTGLQRWPFGDPAAGELSWVGEARGCNTVSGSFSVDSVTYAGDTLKAIGLRFEQHCEGGVSALRGTIYWRSGDAVIHRAPLCQFLRPCGGLPRGRRRPVGTMFF